MTTNYPTKHWRGGEVFKSAENLMRKLVRIIQFEGGHHSFRTIIPHAFENRPDYAKGNHMHLNISPIPQSGGASPIALTDSKPAWPVPTALALAIALCVPAPAAAEPGDGLAQTAADAAKSVLRGWGAAGEFAQRALSPDGSAIGVLTVEQNAEVRQIDLGPDAALDVNSVQLNGVTIGYADIDQSAEVRNADLGREAVLVGNAVAVSNSSLGALVVDQELEARNLSLGAGATVTANTVRVR